jgi:hypothetical protein
MSSNFGSPIGDEGSKNSGTRKQNEAGANDIDWLILSDVNDRQEEADANQTPELQEGASSESMDWLDSFETEESEANGKNGNEEIDWLIVDRTRISGIGDRK